MALDLLLGKTKRDWSCGLDLYLSQSRRREMAEDIVADREVGALGKLVDEEIRRTYSEIARLQSAGKMPANIRRSFKPIYARWLDLSSRQGKFAGSDYLGLVNLRDENRQFAQKLATLSTIASPAATSSPDDRPSSTSPKTMSPLLLGFAGLLGTTIIATLSRKNHS